MREFLGREFLSNTVEDYAWFAGVVLIAFLLKKVLSKYLSRLIYRLVKKYSEGVQADRLYDLLKKPLGFFVIMVVLGAATAHLDWPASWKLVPPSRFGLRMVLGKGYQILMIVSVTWIITRMVSFAGLTLIKKAEKTESKHDDQLIPFAVEIAKVLVAIFAFFVILGSVFGLEIGSLVAGLGIGGLAVALAAKESLENLLASFTIFLDKPFIVGDLVQVGGVTGTVEKVGFRSTRIRTLEKSYLTLPNKKMIDSELDNLTLRTFRRAKFNIGLVYTTTGEQIRAIVGDIKKYLDDHERTNQDAAVTFMEFGDNALTITVEYFVDTMDYNVFLKVREEINYRIMEIVKERGSDFAFPTTTVYLHNSNDKLS